MDSTTRLNWRLEGMDCAACVAKVTHAVERLPGVSGVTVSLFGRSLAFDLAPGQTEPEAVARQVRALGYGVATEPPAGDHHHHHDDDEDGAPWWNTARARLVWMLGALVAAAWIAAHLVPSASHALYLGTTLAALFPFGRRAVALARAGSPFSIETLMVVAALGATVIGAAEEAAFVVLLFAVGEMLEGVAAGRARAGIKALVALVPRTALRRKPDGTTEEVPAERLAIGDLVLVRPGDRVPADGVVTEGASALDESAVTGESMPVARGVGDRLVAGSVNGEAALVMRVTAAGEGSTLARIASLVEQATATRGRTQRFIERFAAWWTPGAMGVAALVMVVPPLVDGEWLTWVYRGLAVLLVACPCALVISVPAAMASGLSAGARRGLLVKGGAALEALGGARTIAFDKTGTLTEGRPRIVAIATAGGVEEDELLRLAAAVESGSSHPLARALREEARRRGIGFPAARAAAAIPGKAVAATVEGRRIGVGSPAWAAEGGVALPPALEAQRERLEQEGHSLAVVTADRAAIGLVAIRDEPRRDAAAALARLRGMGIATVMLTGDNPRTAAAIGAVLGIEPRAGLLPDGKLAAIAALKARGPVAMVGDGINDAPALAAADVGVAMGGGTDVALETADAALLGGRLGGIADLVALSRATLANIRQNVAIAIGLKAVFLATTVAGVTGLWPAILADTGATVLVTLNALRLLGWRPPAGTPRLASRLRNFGETRVR
ncbi:heavy metal translocating P-type ATPase [Falsiroseomonas sp. HW251]|uniref:heavy metal translocating P-type ATPase n=1 Tax=Falsiroseomonas sp. HW251 TaxID=3390998 RepID=UPI003D30F3FB